MPSLPSRSSRTRTLSSGGCSRTRAAAWSNSRMELSARTRPAWGVTVTGLRFHSQSAVSHRTGTTPLSVWTWSWPSLIDRVCSAPSKRTCILPSRSSTVVWATTRRGPWASAPGSSSRSPAWPSTASMSVSRSSGRRSIASAPRSSTLATSCIANTPRDPITAASARVLTASPTCSSARMPVLSGGAQRTPSWRSQALRASVNSSVTGLRSSPAMPCSTPGIPGDTGTGTQSAGKAATAREPGRTVAACSPDALEINSTAASACAGVSTLRMVVVSKGRRAGAVAGVRAWKRPAACRCAAAVVGMGNSLKGRIR